MEGTESPAQALHETDHGRQGSQEDHDGSRTRTAGLYLGDCHQGRANLPTTNCCMKDKNKNLPNRKKAKTLNKAIQLEDKVSRSRSSHEGESSADICDRPGRTRVRSLRQLPTDHDYAVPTREYQLDQSSPIPASAAADPVLDRKRRPAHLDRSLHINARMADKPLTSCRRDARPEEVLIGKFGS